MAALGLVVRFELAVLFVALVAVHVHADLCYDYSCAGECCWGNEGYYCCDDPDLINAWWFWFFWAMFFILFLVGCGALCRHHRMRRRQVIVVQQGYTTTTAYGTLVSSEVPQQPVVSAYAQPARYPYPPPGPPPAGVMQPSAPTLASGPAYQQGAASMHQAQASNTNKPMEPTTYDKPPPYNNGN